VNTGTSWQVNEHGDYAPFNLYAASKQAFETLIENDLTRGLSAITLRLFDTYGPGDTRGKIIDLIIAAVLSGEPLKMSPGEQVIDLVHVSDAARAFVHAGTILLGGTPPAHAIYGVSGERAPLRDVAALIGEIAGTPAPIHWGGRPYRPREIMLPFAGFPSLPGWRPLVGLRDGLQDQLRSVGWRAAA
jgi:nucleoside-diphosphate-sugar epimerase